jgi:hypothetical protein
VNKWFAGVMVLVCSAGAAHAQPAPDERRIPRRVEVGRPMRPVSLDVDLRDLPVVPAWQPGDPVKDIPRREYPPETTPPPLTRRIADPLLDRQPVPPAPNTRDFDQPIIHFDAQNYTGINPPDTVGDVGPNHYVQSVNGAGGAQIVVYDKATGGVLAGPVLLAALGAPSPCNLGFGDPVVLHDALANRWLLAEFPSTGNNICVYISKTPDPVSGGWWFYRLGPLANFPDYPKFAVWPDAYYMTSNEGNAPPVYALDRTNMLNGAIARPAQRFTAPGLAGFGFESLTPADLDGPVPPVGAPAIVARHRDDEVHNAPGTPDDFIDMWQFHVDFDTPASSTFTQLPSIAVSEFSSELCGLSGSTCVPQPGTATRLDTLLQIIMWRLQYRNRGTHQALVGSFVVDADGEPDNPANLEREGVRWFELRKTGANWSLFQEGTHSPDANPRWMGSVAQDKDGNMAVGYSVANNAPAVFPSLRYAGREASDPAGTLRQEIELVTGAAFNQSNRNGDYSAMTVDPVDDCTFWFTAMYNPLNAPVNRWRTHVAAFKFDGCGNAVPAQTAVFDGGLQAPACLSAGRSCDSAATLVGRDTILGGPEPNQPNTIADSCADGTLGRFHVRESIDRVVVRTVDATQMSPGKVVRVDVTLWGFSPGFTSTLDVYYTATAASPAWIYAGSVQSGKVGSHVVTLNYTLPSGPLQAVRARYRTRGESTPCGVGDFTDHDDLVFTVQ